MMRWYWVNLQCRGVLLVLIMTGVGPIALAMGAGWGCLDILALVYHFFFFLALSGTLKYCLKGQLSLKQPTKQPSVIR